MFHKKDAYLTIEASFIMPIVLFLYLMIILAALYLYCRCSVSLDNYLLAMRGARFTYGGEGTGEIIYGETDKKGWSAESYVEERLMRVRRFYPYFQITEGCFYSGEAFATVSSRGSGCPQGMEKTIQVRNPVKEIREGRRK